MQSLGNPALVADPAVNQVLPAYALAVHLVGGWEKLGHAGHAAANGLSPPVQRKDL